MNTILLVILIIITNFEFDKVIVCPYCFSEVEAEICSHCGASLLEEQITQ